MDYIIDIMKMDILQGHPVLPVVVIDDVKQALPLAEALMAGGIGIIEITLRTQAGLDAIRILRSELPEMLVGAGTVVSEKQASETIAAGAQFALAPGTDGATIMQFTEAGIPFVPGVMTPTEIQAALSLGCRYLKFFPAGAVGGTKLLSALASPFASFGVQFCPTGGVSPQNMNEYLGMAAVFAVGGTWIATREDIQAGNWHAITTKARDALELANCVRQKS